MENHDVKPVENSLEVFNRLKEKATQTINKVKDSYQQICFTMNEFRSLGNVLLFRKNSLEIKGYMAGLAPRPYYVIHGVDIIASPRDNNCFHNGIYCTVDLKLILDINYDSENDNFHYFHDNPKPSWICDLSSFSAKVEEYGDKKVGIISPFYEGWDQEIVVENLEKFEELKSIILNVGTLLGLKLKVVPENIKELI